MSKTHLAMGMATSLAVVQPKNFNECIVGLIGGAVGGVLADIDILDNDYKSDALIGQLLSFGITALLLAMDYFLCLGICEYVISHRFLAIVGIVIFIGLWIFGFCSDHRCFTHSILAMIAYTIAIALICSPLTISFIVAYSSHLVLDVLNKKKIQILYPLDFGICIKMCYANKSANSLFMYIGFALTGAILLYSIFAFCIG